MNHYTKAPLPFIGQKRNFLKSFKHALNHIPGDGAGWTIIDAFGGSGLLAHTAKRTKPTARVIYNDFDHYAERLQHIPDTNRLRQILASILADYPRDKHLDRAAKAKAVAAIQSFDGYKDLNCLRSWLLFGSNQARTINELYGKHLYNCIRRNDYREASDYLEGIETTSQPYQTLLPQYLNQPDTLLILDPPYVSTRQGMYTNQHYFGMVQFLHLMDMVRPPFIMFSSTRSEFVDYQDYLKNNKPQEWEKFNGMTRISYNASMSKGQSYEDNMIYSSSKNKPAKGGLRGQR